MSKDVLLDTDVMIDFFRGQEKAREYFNTNLKNINISIITVAELFAGVREGKEKKELEKTTAAIKILPIDYTIASVGGLYRRDYKKSHNVSINDAIIAATARVNNLKLKTFNVKHFPMLNNVSKPYSK